MSSAAVNSHLSLFTRLVRRLRRDEGFAMVAALGMSIVLGIAGTSVVAYSTSNAGAASRSKADQVAFALAEAGVNDAMSVLSLTSNDALDPYLLPSHTTTYEGGTATWSGSLNTSTGVWTLTATGRVRNPTGGRVADVIRSVHASVAVSPSWSAPVNSIAWNYIWATHTGSPCDMTIGQSVNVAAPLYVEGNLCLQNSAVISSGPLAVKGRLTLSQKGNAVGTASAPLNEAHVGAGCQYWNKQLDAPCKGSPDNVTARILDANVPSLTPPVADWNDWYLHANPGPYYPCATQSGPVPVFDNDQGTPQSPDVSHRNNSVPGVFDLTPAASYTCKSDGGELSWDATQNLLTIKGTVYIDGSAVVSNGAVNRYQGQGSLFLSGTMEMKNSKLCAVVSGSDCDTAHWDPNTTLLLIAADGNGGQVPNGDSIQLVSATFQGALYGTNAVETDTTSQAIGPMIGSTIILGQSVSTSFPSIKIVPVGMLSSPTVYAQPGTPVYYG
jgi:hypothetical protein